MIRQAALSDVGRLIELGTRFYEDDGQKNAGAFELARFAIAHITEPSRVCLVAGDPISALLCGVVQPHYFTGEPTAFKTAWYALPKSSGRGAHLLQAFEDWAAENGARRLLISGRRERTLKLLERLSYHTLETVFTKDIPCQKQQSPS